MVWFFFLPLLPLIGAAIVWAARSAGARWAFRVGFPVASFSKHGDISDLAGDGNCFESLDHQAALCHPPNGFIKHSGVVGLAEQTTEGIRLRFYTDSYATGGWGMLIIYSASMFSMPFLGPKMSLVDNAIGLSSGAAFALILAYSFRRARRRAHEFAERAGFSVGAPRSGPVEPAAASRP